MFRPVRFSQSALQQGEPLSSLLYCLSTLSQHRNLSSELNKSYLDDDALGGPCETVLDDFTNLESNLSKTGLKVNIAKFDIFLLSDSVAMRQVTTNEIHSVFCGLPTVLPKKLEYLGSPLLSEAFEEVFLKKS